jgi:hypothetical protein
MTAVAVALTTVVAGAGPAAAAPGAVTSLDGCGSTVLARNDDQSSGVVQLPFDLNFYGVGYNQLFVNNNGNVTFDGPPVDAPTLPAHLTAEDLGSAWGDFTGVTWQQWLNQTAAANDAPSWSQGLTSTPACVMAPWGASVNGEHVTVSTPTGVDARTATSGCSGATLQGMTLDLGADLVLQADQLTFVNGLTVTSVDGSDHVLQIVVPSDDATAIALAAPNGITASPQVQVQVVTGGGVQINGATSVPALLDVGFLRASGSVDLVRPGTA